MILRMNVFEAVVDTLCETSGQLILYQMKMTCQPLALHPDRNHRDGGEVEDGREG